MEPLLSLNGQILIALGLIGLNACFVLAEFAIVRVRSSRLEVLVRQGNARAARVQDILQDLDVYLSAIQMGITMASLGLGWVGEPAVAHLLQASLLRIPLPHADILVHGASFAIAFAIITFLHILLGELVPRTIALQRAELVALWSAFPLRLFYLTFKTPVTVLANASIGIMHLFRLGAASETEAHLSEEEIRVILGSSEEKGSFSLERLMLIENIFDFGAAKVADVMVPKEKVACLSLAKPWEENLALIRARRFSRYPLCRLDLQTAFAVVHLKDLVLIPGLDAAKPSLEAVRRELVAVAPGDSLQRLLQAFADKGTHMALVRAAQGQVVGLITLEDIIEEIVGEVRDEYDQPQTWSLMDVLVPGGADVGLDGPDAASAIRRLLSRIRAVRPEIDEVEAQRLILDRESKFSSAVGHGLAIPHARLPGLGKPLMAIGRSPKPLAFQSPDKAPVRLVFLVLTPAGSPIVQLKILARVASLVSNDNLRRRLLRAKSAEHLVDILRTADTVLAI